MASGIPERNERLRLAGAGPARGAHASKHASRVVLVGRTGLDEAARSANGAEVLRAQTLLDGVAEVAVPLGVDSPRACIVLVADDAMEQGERVAGPGAGVEFVSAVRRAAPGAKVYRVGTVVDGAFDGNVPSNCDTAMMERLMATAAGEPGVADRVTGPVVSSASRVASIDDREIEDLMAVMLDDVGAASDAKVEREGAASAVTALKQSGATTSVWTDESLAQRLAKGHGVWNEVERLLRARCGDAGLSMRRADEGVPRGVEVISGGRVLARLVPSTQSAAVLERVQGFVSWVSSWLMLDEQMRMLREAAFKDPLTGAWNRRYFEKFLPAAIEQAREAKRFVTVLLFDIDDFKRWNDRYGHRAGDEVLRETVRLMESAVRPTDRVCRIGGDEFAVIFHEPAGPREVGSKHPEDVTSIAERFSALIRAKRFPKLGEDAPGRLGVSGGLATYPWDGRDMHELLRVADERALGCKRHGKNAIVFGDGAGESR